VTPTSRQGISIPESFAREEARPAVILFPGREFGSRGDAMEPAIALAPAHRSCCDFRRGIIYRESKHDRFYLFH